MGEPGIYLAEFAAQKQLLEKQATLRLGVNSHVDPAALGVQ